MDRDEGADDLAGVAVEDRPEEDDCASAVPAIADAALVDRGAAGVEAWRCDAAAVGVHGCGDEVQVPEDGVLGLVDRCRDRPAADQTTAVTAAGGHPGRGQRDQVSDGPGLLERPLIDVVFKGRDTICRSRPERGHEQAHTEGTTKRHPSCVDLRRCRL